MASRTFQTSLKTVASPKSLMRAMLLCCLLLLACIEPTLKVRVVNHSAETVTISIVVVDLDTGESGKFREMGKIKSKSEAALGSGIIPGGDEYLIVIRGRTGPTTVVCEEFTHTYVSKARSWIVEVPATPRPLSSNKCQ